MKDHKHNGEDKRPLLLEDLRHHSPEQLAELRLLLESGTPLEPIRESEAFFAVEGPLHVFYVCKNRAGTEILLIVARKRPPTNENEKFRMPGETCDSISSFA